VQNGAVKLGTEVLDAVSPPSGRPNRDAQRRPRRAVPATLVRTALGLRSTWVTMGVLRLDRPSRGAVVFGSSTHLSGVGRGLGAPRLASSPDGAAWTTVVTGAPDTAGELAFDVSPTRTMRYRLEAEGGASPALLVQVAPRLTLAKADRACAGVLTGTIAKLPPGLRSRSSGRLDWVLVGEAGRRGWRLRAELDAAVSPGSYRARNAPGEASSRRIADRAGRRRRGVPLVVVTRRGWPGWRSRPPQARRA
jgi:hypothetical protein